MPLLTEFMSTRYDDYSFLKALGLFESVYFMLDIIGWNHFVSVRHPTYERLTLEFLSSYSYELCPLSSVYMATVRYKMFNQEYSFSQD